MILSRTVRGVVGIFLCVYPAARVFRRIAIQAMLICLALVLFSTSAYSSALCTISGTVYDKTDGQPVSSAEVRILDTEFKTTTTQNGRFTLSNIPEGQYQIEIYADGYEPSVLQNVSAIAGIDNRLTVNLVRRIYDFGQVKVTSDRVKNSALNIQTVTRDEIISEDITSLSEALENIQGVYVQESGASGGSATVSIRGCDPKHVLIIVDGQRLNAAGTGIADLNAIPLDNIEKIEVHKGGQSARFGSDAIGGVISISTIAQNKYSPEVSIRQKIERWRGYRGEISARDFLPLKQVPHRFSFSRYRTDADFEYDYFVSPDLLRHEIGRRVNASFAQENLFGSAGYSLDSSLSISFSGQYYKSRGGMPGPVSSPDSTAWKQDKRISFYTGLKHQASEAITHELNVSFSRFEQYFNNNNLDTLLEASEYETRFINDIALAELNQNFIAFKGNDITTGIEFQRNILYHNDIVRPKVTMGRMVRDNIGIYLSDRQTISTKKLRFIDAFTLLASARWDNTDTKRDQIDSASIVRHNSNFAHKFDLSLVKGNESRILFRASYGSSYRLPSVNALFWKGDVRSSGNPDLKPEQAEHSEAGFEFHFVGGFKLSAGMTYFHSYTKGLIVWQPGSPGNIWKPKNLDAAFVTGHEDFVKLQLFDEHITLRYQNTITVPKNRTPEANFYNKDLTFRPRYSTLYQIKFDYGPVFGEYEIREVARRFALPANTKWYDAYRIENYRIGIKANLSRFDCRLSYKMKNSRGEDYVLIAQYPMPRINWAVSLTVTYAPGKKLKTK
ncbi:MAG: TonB-dependent receptor [candidate division Zixibacteria bacterium]|nr:TonB-dependent receptor [candidate division Zixibacteria bacterium]